MTNRKKNASFISAQSEYFIVDAVAHSYNQSPDNFYKKLDTVNGSYVYHKMSNPPQHQLTQEQWARDWKPEEFIDMMLLESTTDVICMHSVPLFDYAKDGLVSNEKGAYLKKHYPDRIVWYAALDLGQPPERTIALLDKVAAEGADGIKLYPTGVNRETREKIDWAMDDRKVAFPIFDEIQKRGIKHVAVHKLLEYDAVTLKQQKYYGINDIAVAAKAYPGLNFHVVHAGWALLEDTILLMQEYQNVIAVLEGPFFFPIIDRKRFDIFMHKFMTTVGPDRMLYASAATNPHPRWIIEAFINYEPPADAGFALTKADKAKIFGESFARVHGIDIARRKAAIANDRFSRYRKKNGLRSPWAGILS